MFEFGFFAVALALIIAVLGLIAVTMKPSGIVVIGMRDGRPIGIFYIHKSNEVNEVIATRSGFVIGEHAVSAK